MPLNHLKSWQSGDRYAEKIVPEKLPNPGVASLALHLSSLADLGRETSLDGGDTASGAAVVAGDEIQTVLSLVEVCVGGLARLACYVLDYKVVSRMN